MIAPLPRDAGAYMQHHSRSFRFATILLPRRDRGRLERVYAWCRHTDDIVDRAPGGRIAGAAAAHDALDRWLAASRQAYDGHPSGVPLLDQVMSEMREAATSFHYAEAVVAGVRSDLAFTPPKTLSELRTYTHNVASVIGLWLCGLFGVRDSWMLARAAELGHAMQLTNILRDVGEDLDDGRIYLPADALQASGVTPDDLTAMRRGTQPVDARYRGLMEFLMAQADSSYRLAGEAIPLLPRAFGRSVAMAAATYAGIHDEIRANDYDNFTRRARTRLTRKITLAGQALWELPASRPSVATRAQELV